ncbi:MAG: MarR family transcriptional regulator [Spirochaetia bacterium]|jgi:DNA-binding MarR family transcriptional regulator
MRDGKDTDIVRQWVQNITIRSLHGMAHDARAQGLSMPQYSILMRLRHTDGCAVHDIGRMFDVSAAAASQLVEKLVQSGFVARTEDPADRRARKIAITAKGRALIARGLAERFRWVDELVDGLPPRERAALVRFLRPLVEREQGMAVPGHAIRGPRERHKQ